MAEDQIHMMLLMTFAAMTTEKIRPIVQCEEGILFNEAPPDIRYRILQDCKAVVDTMMARAREEMDALPTCGNA